MASCARVIEYKLHIGARGPKGRARARLFLWSDLPSTALAAEFVRWLTGYRRALERAGEPHYFCSVEMSPLVAQAGKSDAVTPDAEKDVLALQGGGALGAYQAGAYAALCDAGHMPRWVAGTSIGAVNAAIIAGNQPEHRVSRLREFWEGVSSCLLGWPLAEDGSARRIFNETSAALSAAGGVPGFFDPRIPPAVVMPQGTPEAISVYDTGPLRATLLKLVDFDLLNSGAVRLSIGAVQVLSGNMQYFDTATQVIGPDHVMASGALPPGFPPIEIDGEPYWDGGLVSNTPLEYVLERSGPREDMCIFQVDLFSAKGCMPQTLFDVTQREKEIRYSSRTRLNTDVFRELQTIRRAVRQLRAKVPQESATIRIGNSSTA